MGNLGSFNILGVVTGEPLLSIRNSPPFKILGILSQLPWIKTRYPCVQPTNVAKYYTWGQGGWAKASEQVKRRKKYWRSLWPCFPSLSRFMMLLLGCSWLPLPPCLPSLSLFISILGCSWPPLLRCVPSLSPFKISSGLLLAAALYPR